MRVWISWQRVRLHGWPCSVGLCLHASCSGNVKAQLWINSLNRLYKPAPWLESNGFISMNRLHVTEESGSNRFLNTHIRLGWKYKTGYLVMCEFLWLWNEDSVAHFTLRLGKQVAIFLDQSVHWNTKATCWIKRFGNSTVWMAFFFFNGRNLFISDLSRCFFLTHVLL